MSISKLPICVGCRSLTPALGENPPVTQVCGVDHSPPGFILVELRTGWLSHDPAIEDILFHYPFNPLRWCSKFDKRICFWDIQHRKYIEQASVSACTLRDVSDMNMRSIADLLEKIGPKSVQPSRGKGLNQPGHAVVLWSCWSACPHVLAFKHWKCTRTLPIPACSRQQHAVQPEDVMLLAWSLTPSTLNMIIPNTLDRFR